MHLEGILRAFNGCPTILMVILVQTDPTPVIKFWVTSHAYKGLSPCNQPDPIILL